MTRAEREVLALKRREEEINQKKEQIKLEEEKRKNFLQQAKKGIFEFIARSI